MIADVALCAVAVLVTWWALDQLASAWRERPRPVRDVDGRWRAAPRPRNGWGPRR